jgi:predicted dehydrogenase
MITRRHLFKQAAAAAGGTLTVPALIPSSALGLDGTVAPADRVTVGFIGVGDRGMHVLKNGFLPCPEAQVVAMCDATIWRTKNGVQTVDQAYGTKGCRGFADFRDLLAAPDVDAVYIGTPDHWHTPAAILSAKAGKDVYSEKPVTLTIAQGQALCEVMKRHGRIYQSGTQGRSGAAARQACELVRNGKIGKVHRLDIELPNSRPIEAQNLKAGIPSLQPIQEGFDYDMWLGPAPWVPHRGGCFWDFRWRSDYGGGYISDWGTHLLDFAQWMLGTDGSGPVRVEGKGERMTGFWNVHSKYEVEFTYADGARVGVRENQSNEGLLKATGSEGAFTYSWNAQQLTAESRDYRRIKTAPGEIQLYASDNHVENFIRCVRSRQPTISPAEVGHRSASMCHLAVIAMDLGLPLDWDPVAERFSQCEEANRMVARSMRSPWHL